MPPRTISKEVQKPDVPDIIKTGACIVLLIVAMVFVSLACRELADHYLLLLLTPSNATIAWVIQFSVSAFALAVFAGIVAILVRPLWVALLAAFLAALVYPLVVGSEAATWITAVGIFLLFVAIFTYVARQLKNQINFSAHPLVDMKMLLLMLSAIMVSVALGMGYAHDAAKRQFILPPEIKTILSQTMFDTAKSAIDTQTITPALKKVALAEAQKRAATSADDIEKGFEPSKAGLPYVFGGVLFFLLVTIFSILAFIPPLLVRLMFLLLRVTGFAHETVETREVKHLTLHTVPLVPNGKK